jgi:hypothetical protein
VADWWLGRAVEAVLDVVAAAVAPATTTDRAKMRIASFIIGNLSGIQLAEDAASTEANHRACIEISHITSWI